MLAISTTSAQTKPFLGFLRLDCTSKIIRIIKILITAAWEWIELCIIVPTLAQFDASGTEIVTSEWKGCLHCYISQKQKHPQTKPWFLTSPCFPLQLQALHAVVNFSSGEGSSVFQKPAPFSQVRSYRTTTASTTWWTASYCDYFTHINNATLSWQKYWLTNTGRVF